MHKLLLTLACISLVAGATMVSASPVITLPEVEALFPDYVNHEQQNGFATPCVVNGKISIDVNVADILGQVNGPIAVAMVCQMVGYPAFTPVGPVTFSHPGVQLLSLQSVPGHPDAFAIEMLIPEGADQFNICIENSGWPDGCLEDLLDWAAWDLAAVGTDATSIGKIKALY